MSYQGVVLKVAVPSPLREALDYLPPASTIIADDWLGCRVEVTLGRRTVIGVVVAIESQSSLSEEQLKPIVSFVDTRAVVSPHQLALLQWVSQYYHHPIGDVVCRSMPKWLREGRPINKDLLATYALSEQGKCALRDNLASKHQHQCLSAIANARYRMTEFELKARDVRKKALDACLDKQWVDVTLDNVELSACLEPPPYALTLEQKQAITTIRGQRGFGCYVLHGVTGSGKTEVYMQCLSHVLKSGQQGLLLVPEIGLTPQTQQRMIDRFHVPVLMLHSALSDGVRYQQWLSSSMDRPCLLLGTRSALFAPLPKLGIIILDEEHDGSYKQQSRLRYSARDVAVKRANMLDIPIVLGTATPSLETLYNIEHQRYHRLSLSDRVSGGVLPKIVCHDLKGQAITAGIANSVHQTMQQHLAKGKQVLLFLNRRGYAPVLMCHHCGWVVVCPQCDARVTMHYHETQMRCHHCDRRWPLLRECQSCCQSDLHPVGIGTERLMKELQAIYPHQSIVRIDADTVTTKKQWDEALAVIHQGKAQIIVGTQMITKGHHFSDISLVVIVDADSGLYSTDYRASENMGQQITQVAGRSGREHFGEVIIQTHHSDHPMWKALIDGTYAEFMAMIQQERRMVELPPYVYQVLLRAEAKTLGLAERFFNQVAQVTTPKSTVSLIGPMAAPMPKRNGQYRSQMILQSKCRSELQQWLSSWVGTMDDLSRSMRCQWSIDVDPMDMS